MAILQTFRSFTLLTILTISSFSISGCRSDKKSDSLFESNRPYESIDKNFKMITANSDLSIIYLRIHDVELRRECWIIKKEGNHWYKLTYHLSFQGDLSKVSETMLSDNEGVNLYHRLTSYHIFDIPLEETLLKEHKKLCGTPQDPSHYLEFSLLIISGENVRELHFTNPKGRYLMCPAIKQWDNASRVSDFFETEWAVVN